MANWVAPDITNQDEYNHVNCSSLFGYGEKVHRRHTYVCQLCGCGGMPVDFDLWRQLTVEHLIGESQGGYPKELRRAIAARFPDLSVAAQQFLVTAIDDANTVTACSFCNSTTSRDRHGVTMNQLVLETEGSEEDVLIRIKIELAQVLDRKRSDVAWKLRSIRRAFNA